MPGHARHARISRSQQSSLNVAVTVSAESQRDSKPSEHQRVSRWPTATVPSCGWLDCARFGPCPVIPGVRRSAGDYVIATGVTTSLQDFVREAFAAVGLDWQDHVDTDPTLYRPTDLTEG